MEGERIMADGYAVIEINTKGKGRIQEVQFFDIRLTTFDFDSNYILEELMNQLPEGINDVLIMALFNYKSESSYDSWSGATEYEDSFLLESHNSVKTNYKEFSREQLTLELECESPFGFMDSLEDIKYRENLKAEWEEFYDEDFVPTPTKKPRKIPSKGESLFEL
jgi:hypothetical protein